MTQYERELLIKMIVNIDDIIKILIPEQRKELERTILEIYENYYELIDLR